MSPLKSFDNAPRSSRSWTSSHTALVSTVMLSLSRFALGSTAASAVVGEFILILHLIFSLQFLLRSSLTCSSLCNRCDGYTNEHTLNRNQTQASYN
eukprot:scaffold7000_cov156-Skeletonema_dohrnii-CCMP3373.AAC.19